MTQGDKIDTYWMDEYMRTYDSKVFDSGWVNVGRSPGDTVSVIAYDDYCVIQGIYDISNKTTKRIEQALTTLTKELPFIFKSTTHFNPTDIYISFVMTVPYEEWVKILEHLPKHNGYVYTPKQILMATWEEYVRKQRPRD